MEKLFTLLLLLLFVPYLFGLAGTNMLGSDIASSDKFIKIGLLYLMSLVLLVRKDTAFRKDVSIYLFPSIIYILILSYHYIYSSMSYDADLLSALKEILRLAFFIVMLVYCASLSMKIADYRHLAYQFALFGIPLGLMSVYSALTGTSSRRTMYIGEFVRAGGDLTATNNLAAVLNITTLFAFGAFLLVKKPYQKVGFLLAALISQVGRLVTFSNGSVISIVVSLLVLLFLFRKADQPTYRVIRRVSIIIIVVLALFTIVSGKAELMFGRLVQTNETGYLVSISSRTYQYAGLWKVIVNKPEHLLLGVGSPNVQTALGTSQTMHNAYLLPLISAGVGGFASFCFLWWRSLQQFYTAFRLSIGHREDMILMVIVLAAFVGYSVQILTVPYSLSASTWFFIILSYSLSSYISGKRAEAVQEQ